MPITRGSVYACIPSRKVLVRPDDTPWFNNEIRKFCRKRDRLKKEAFKSGKVSILNKYKHLRNKINNIKNMQSKRFLALSNLIWKLYIQTIRKDSGVLSDTLSKRMTVLRTSHP